MYFIGVVLSALPPLPIREDSTAPASLCVQLLDFAQGLERASIVGINFVPAGGATEGNYNKNNVFALFGVSSLYNKYVSFRKISMHIYMPYCPIREVSSIQRCVIDQ